MEVSAYMTYEESLKEKGFVKTSITKTMLNGEELSAWLYTNSLCNNNWEVANHEASVFYDEVNDWLISEGFGSKAHSSRLLSYCEADNIRLICKTSESVAWLSTGAKRSNEHYAVDTEGVTTACDDSRRALCFPLV